jgi:hypothetical protein
MSMSSKPTWEERISTQEPADSSYLFSKACQRERKLTRETALANSTFAG